MTEAPDAKKDGQAASDASWRVDGAVASPSEAEGLGDTVVQMPRIPAEKPAAVKPRMGRTRNQQSKAQQSKTAAPAARPAMPKPAANRPDAQPKADAVKSDLMAPFDRPAPGSSPAATPSSAASPKPAPSVQSQEPTVAVPTTEVPQAAPAAVPVASMMARPAPRPATASSGARRTRKARLRLARVDPWSVMKTVFLFSVAFGIVAWVATYLLWQILLASGLFAAINSAILDIASSPNNTEGWRIEDYLSANKVLGIAALLGVINVVLSTALGTIMAFLYNLSANILGGLELTLAED